MRVGLFEGIRSHCEQGPSASFGFRVAAVGRVPHVQLGTHLVHAQLLALRRWQLHAALAELLQDPERALHDAGLGQGLGRLGHRSLRRRRHTYKETKMVTARRELSRATRRARREPPLSLGK